MGLLTRIYSKLKISNFKFIFNENIFMVVAKLIFFGPNNLGNLVFSLEAYKIGVSYSNRYSYIRIIKVLG